MRILKSLLFLASLAAAEKVPVLTEPLVVAAQGATLDAGTDSVFLGGKGRIGLYTRTANQIQTIVSSPQPRIDSDLPLMFVCGTQHCVLGSDSLYRNFQEGASQGNLYDTLDPIFGKGLGISGGFANAGKFYGSSFVAGAGAYVDHFLIAGDTKVREFVYAYRSEDSTKVSVNGFRVKDSMATAWGHPLLGFSDRGAVGSMATSVKRGEYAIRSDSSKFLLSTSRIDSLHADSLNWIVADSKGLWLAYDQQRSIFYRKYRLPDGFVTIDSVPAPELKSGNRRTYQVTRVDSLLVFNTDSAVVLARWTVDDFRILSIVPLGKPVLAATMAQSGTVYNPTTKQYERSNSGTLWATTGSELYSFKLVWQEQPTSGGIHRGGFETNLVARGSRSGQGMLFTWNGTGSLPVEILDLHGRKFAASEIRAGQSLSWIAPHEGLYLLKSPQGSRTFLAR